MFGKFGDMMGKLQEMKQKADEIKQKLDTASIKVTGASGDIQIEISGNRKIKDLKIAETLQHGNKEVLEEQLLITLNKAIEEAGKMNETEMQKAASGLLPGM